jgi:hypothetical protein
MEGAVGSYDQRTGLIRIIPQPRAGQFVTLIHEALHAVECAAINAGVLDEETIEAHHEFVGMAANGLAMILSSLGLVKIPPEEIEALFKE